MTRRICAAGAICLTLAVAHTWPIASAPHRLSLNHNADAQLNAWIVSWVAYALPHEPRHLFTGNIFQPDDHALAYSEPLVVPALVGAPIRWFGGSAVLTFNVLLILGLAATALAGWWLVDRWTGSFGGGLVAGALLAFNTHLLTRLPHLQAAHAWGLPLAYYFTDRLLTTTTEAPRQRQTVVLWALTMAAIAMTSEYWLVFAGLISGVQVIAGPRSRGSLRAICLAGVLSVLFAAPVLLPYLRLAGEGVRRPLEMAARLSAVPSAYLVSNSRIDELWSHRFFTRDIDVLFPGFGALLLAAVGVHAAYTDGNVMRRRAAALITVAIVGVVLSFGPATPVYRLAYGVLLPLQGLRVPARFGFLLLFAVAVTAGLGTASLIGQARSARARALITLLAVGLVTVEAWSAPIQTTPFTTVPRIYENLDRERQPALLVEVPFWPPDTVYANAEYVLNATEHRTPIMNGYSGFTPDSYRRRAQWFWFFPERWAIEAMRKEGATHVMVHFEQFGPDADAVKAGLSTQPDLQLVAEDPRGHRLYRLTARNQ